METLCQKKGWQLYLPALPLCGDNAAMIGAQGYYEARSGVRADLSLNAWATMPIEQTV
jgi:N6-L-threonylcarbamoyladenine synthase